MDSNWDFVYDKIDICSDNNTIPGHFERNRLKQIKTGGLEEIDSKIMRDIASEEEIVHEFVFFKDEANIVIVITTISKMERNGYFGNNNKENFIVAENKANKKAHIIMGIVIFKGCINTELLKANDVTKKDDDTMNGATTIRKE